MCSNIVESGQRAIHLLRPGDANPSRKNAIANRAVFRVADPAPISFHPFTAKQAAMIAKLATIAKAISFPRVGVVVVMDVYSL
jgi:hypothetical protein